MFAPGWVYETINTRIGFDGLTPGTEKYRSRYNEIFLNRSDNFWNSLYNYFYIYGPKNLPFSTNFCIGSGRKFYRMGKEIKGNWFNLKMQAFQPSMPSSLGYFTHFYEDAFNGGSCLSIDSNSLIRLFTSELPCKDGIIFSYTFKRDNDRCDLEVHLNLINPNRNREMKIVCKSKQTDGNEISPLSQESVRSLNIFLANKGQMPIPERIHNWETRFYVLLFHENSPIEHLIVSDIGVKKNHQGKVLLGQMAFYSAHGIINEIENLSKIHF